MPLASYNWSGSADNFFRWEAQSGSHRFGVSSPHSNPVLPGLVAILTDGHADHTAYISRSDTYQRPALKL